MNHLNLIPIYFRNIHYTGTNGQDCWPLTPIVNRSDEINPGVWSDIWPVTLDQPLPLLPIPLEPPDPDVLLDLNAVVRTVYERAAYTRRIDYRDPAPPPELRPTMAQWLQAPPVTV
ncbi:MAG: DUF4058 family protein [Caldilineaceae bacterium]